jgi:hypothetical protein
MQIKWFFLLLKCTNKNWLCVQIEIPTWTVSVEKCFLTKSKKEKNRNIKNTIKWNENHEVWFEKPNSSTASA